MILRWSGRSSRGGFTRVDLGLIVFVVVVIAVMTGYRLGREREKRLLYACAENLKNIGLTFRKWSPDGRDKFPFELSTKEGGSAEFTNVSNHFRRLSDISNTWRLVCPAGGKRPAATWDAIRDENVSYFVGLSSAEIYPQSFLSGDSGFLISSNAPPTNPVILRTNSDVGYPVSVHKGVGNICFADGSVQQLNAAKLKTALQASNATNVILLPR